MNQKYLWLEVLKFNDRGLIPAIVQDNQDASVLTLVWMGKNSLGEVINTGILNSKYTVIAVFYDGDGDGDALICKVEDNQYASPKTRRGG